MNLRELVERLQVTLNRGDYPETDIVSVHYDLGDDYLTIRNGPHTAVHLAVTKDAKRRNKKAFEKKYDKRKYAKRRNRKVVINMKV